MRTGHRMLKIASVILMAFLLGSCKPKSAPDVVPSAPNVPTSQPGSGIPATSIAEPTPAESSSSTELGTSAQPIRIIVSPLSGAKELEDGSAALVAALSEATGLVYEILIVDSFSEAIDAICEGHSDSVGIFNALTYIIAHDRCQADVSRISIIKGWDSAWTQFLVARNSEYRTIGDLNGLVWGRGKPNSVLGNIIPAMHLAASGVVVSGSSSISPGGDAVNVLAVFDGKVDFGTSSFFPPLLPEGKWSLFDRPEPYDDQIDQCGLSDDSKKILCGGYTIRDARSLGPVRARAGNQIIQQVRILALSTPVPNDAIVFGSDVDPMIRMQLEAALDSLLGTDTWTSTFGLMFKWTGYRVAQDADYSQLRELVQASRFDENKITTLLDYSP